jgi:hypothetical protein
MLSRGVYGDDPELIADNMNMARLLELQRLLAPVMGAQWIVLHDSSGSIITNDLGLTLHDQGEPTPGAVIPLRPDAALSLIPLKPSHGRKLLFDAGAGRWQAFIDHEALSRQDVWGLNGAVATAAQEFIVGSTRKALEAYAARFRDPPMPVEMIEWIWPSHRMMLMHEWEWYRLASAIRYPAGDSRLASFDVDFEVIAADWHPTVFLGVNIPEFATGLRCRGKSIEFGMTEVPGFTGSSS